MSDSYRTAWNRSIESRDAFWRAAADAIDWLSPPQGIYDEAEGWFARGKLNTASNCLDRHVTSGRGDATALIYDSPVTGQVRHFSYAELLAESGRLAAMLIRLGAAKGDRVIVYMPMIPETVFGMLACARIGAIHSVVFGGFAALELAKRIDDAKPRLVLTASCGVESSRLIAYKPMVDEALALAEHKVEHVLLFQRNMLAADLHSARDIDWVTFRAQCAADPIPEPEPMASNDPLYILYTSGTTGTPKGVVREHGGHAVALAWSMANIYGVGGGEAFWAASDVGWVVGHSYIVYAPLLVGATTILFEGKPVGTPDPGTFWRTISAHGVKSFFCAPTAIRAIRKEDPEGSFLTEIGTGNLRAIFLAGERADPDTIEWLEEKSGLPVFDHWWQTELGWPAIASCFGLGDLRRKPGSAGFPVPGYEFVVMGDDGPRAVGESGAITIKTPLPPGAFRTLWNNEAGFERNFERFGGLYETGDAGHVDEEGFLHIMGRTDDIIKVSAHRLSTGLMEQIVAEQDGVAECAVIGADDAIKGMIPVAFIVPRADAPDHDLLAREVVAAVRAKLGAVAALKNAYVVPQLPKTRSGKILRNLLRKLVNNQPVETPPTIEDPAVPGTIAAILAKQIGPD